MGNRQHLPVAVDRGQTDVIWVVGQVEAGADADL
jgi:hypothetical protein